MRIEFQNEFNEAVWTTAFVAISSLHRLADRPRMKDEPTQRLIA